MAGKNIIQNLRSIMEGEAKMLNHTFLLLFQEIVPKTIFLKLRSIFSIHGMEKIEVKIAGACPFKGDIQLPLGVIAAVAS